MTYPELFSILEEVEGSLWDDRLWSMALKSDKPVDVYNEGRRGLEEEPAPSIDSLPNKDWLRAM